MNTRRISTKAFERNLSNIEAFMEEHLEYDCVYCEINDRETESFATVINDKMLLNLLTEQPNRQLWKLVVDENRQKLVEYLQECAVIDRENNCLKIENWKFLQAQAIVETKRMLSGDHYTYSFEPDNSLVQKRLIYN